MTETPLVRLDAVTLEFADEFGGRIRVLHGVNLDIPQGKTMALLGESGSGKSLTALALAGLLPEGGWLEGAITWAGGHSLRPGAGIGVVFQDPMSSLNPVLTIGEQIAEVLVTHRNVPWSEAWRRAEVALARVHIADPARVARAFAHQLSGGMRQRACLAMALAGEPRLLILDEPTTALDVSVQARIMALVSEIAAEGGMSILLVTHDIALASQVAEEAAILYAGRVVERASMLRLLETPRHPYTQALLASALDFDGPRPDRLAEIPGAPPMPEDIGVGCPFAPRCSQATQRCFEDDPPPRLGVRCWNEEGDHE